MTKKLYDIDSHMRAFCATVVSCEKKGKRFEAVLDETAFFPEACGQTADTGTIEGAKVIGARIDNDVIYHIIDKPLEAGARVECALDWDKRFRKMQNHTGEHIISGITNRLYGYDNVGFHLGSDDVTLDFNGELSKEQLREIEYLANVEAAKNSPVTAEYPSPGELEKMSYRSKLELRENVRIVTVEGCDRCACCAPHVSRTGEIGMIKILDHMRYKGGVRIHIQCGLDALADYNAKYDNILSISAQLSAKQHETAEKLSHFLAEGEKLKAERRSILMKYCALLLKTIDDSAPNPCVFESDMPEEGLRELVNGMTAKGEGICGAFSEKNGGFFYVIGSSAAPMREFAKKINAALGGKGGGTDRMIQGSLCCSREDITAFFDGI